MTLFARLSLTLCVALLPACKDTDAGETSPASSTSGTTETPGTSTSTGTTAAPTTSGSSSTGAPPVDSCTAVTSEAECLAKDMCDWKGVVQYTYGSQGCQGNVVDFCIAKTPAGSPSAWYREVDGDAQVVEFGYGPEDLPGEWQECSCDGPLTCMCPSIAPDCPERYEEFCAGIGVDSSCSQVTTHGDLICDWFSVSPEGAKDDTCADAAVKNTCLPATKVGTIACDPPIYSFPPCVNWSQELFWREVNGEIEVITTCGPQPLGWTQCLGDDTPDQPDECKCRCL